jgi:hypothetical protein
MTVTRHYLSERRFTITVDQQIRDDGAVAYLVSGKHFNGLILVEPWVTGDQAVPDPRWAVTLGEGHLLADRRTSLPVVRGTTVYGGAGPVDFTDPRWAAHFRLYRKAHTATTTRQRSAGEYDLAAVMVVIAQLHQQLDHRPLLVAAAKATAGRRLRDCAHSLHSTYRLYAECRDDLRRETVLAAELQQLSPLPLLDPASHDRWHGCVDPDVYLHADDDGDWLTCPSCDRHITRLDGGDRLGSLLNEVAAHHCA